MNIYEMIGRGVVFCGMPITFVLILTAFAAERKKEAKKIHDSTPLKYHSRYPFCVALLLLSFGLNAQDCGYSYRNDTTARHIDSSCTNTITQVKYTCYTGRGWFRHKSACYRPDTLRSCTYDTSYTIVQDSTPIPCTTAVKPPLSGCMLRQEKWFNSTNPDTAWLNAIGGNIVIRMNVKDLWPERHRIDYSYIDQWVTFARYWTARGVPIHYKYRVLFGVFAPQWMRDSIGAFPLDKTGYETTPGFDQADDSCIKFWTTPFLNLYAELMDSLAARYDTVSCFSEIVVAATGIGTAEPLIFGVGNAGSGLTRRGQYLAAGATVENTTAAIYTSIDAMSAFHYTNIGIAASTFQRISIPSYEEIETTKAIDTYMANLFGERAVLGNNGLEFRNTDGSLFANWTAPNGNMYLLQQDYISNRNTFGSRIYNQTAAKAQMGGYNNLLSVLDHGVAYGDILIELPDVEKQIKLNLTNEQLRHYRDLLKANQ